MKSLKISSFNIIPLLLLLYSSTFLFSEELDIFSSLRQRNESVVSILFLIDHSGSMSIGSGGNGGMDQWGERFKVPYALVDSISNIFDSAEVAVVVFRRYLYYDPVDNSRFAQCPQQDTGAYLPFFRLDSSYAPDGKFGHEIVKEFLDYDTVTSGLNTYVDLKYMPTNLAQNLASTNITAGFHAAKYAFKSARFPKNCQFIIFFSDGVANYPGGEGSPEANQYLEDVKADIPTTFTVFFIDGPDPPQDLVDMTGNIKANGYSIVNDSSALWTIDLGQQTLMDFILDNIITIIVDEKIPKIIPYPSPTYNRRPTLTWHLPREPGSSHTIQISTVSDFSTTIVNVPVVDTFYTTQVNLPFGTIYWRVKSDISDWSKIGSFVLLDDRIPLLIPHQNPTVLVQPTLSWCRTTGTVSVYTIQISSVQTFNPVILETSTPDTFYTCQSPLPYGMIYWRVRGDDSEFSSTGSFLINDNRIPILIPYEDPTFNRKPTLTWRKPPTTVTIFTIQIAKNSDFLPSVVNEQVSDTFYTCQSNLPFGQIYWRVKADDSQFSSKGSFLLKDGRTPVLIPYFPKLTNNVAPILKWHRLTDATTYTIEIDTIEDFASTIVSVPVSDTSFTPTVPLPFGEIFWRIKSDLNPTWSDTDYFAIQPDTIPFIFRYNGKAINNKRPVFKWYSVSGATSYIIIIADNSSFNNAINLPVSDTSYTMQADLDYKKWYWAVSSSYDFDLFCPTDNLVIDSLAPIKNLFSHEKPGIYISRTLKNYQIIFRGMSCSGVRATVYNIKGRVVSSIGPMHQGQNILTWDFKDQNGMPVSSGIYLLNLVTPEKRLIYRILISR